MSGNDDLLNEKEVLKNYDTEEHIQMCSYRQDELEDTCSYRQDDTYRMCLPA